MLNAQVLDQTLKGAISAAVGYVFARFGLDAGGAAAVTVVIYHLLARVSKQVGLKGVANFFAKGAAPDTTI